MTRPEPRTRKVDRIDVGEGGIAPLARAVEEYIRVTPGMTPSKFSLEVCGRRDLVADLRKGRKLGEVKEAQVRLFLARQSFKPECTDGVLTPSLQSLAERDRAICGNIRVEALYRRLDIQDLLGQLVVIGWNAYAAERGLE